MELCDTAVLVVINVLTRGIGVIVVVVGAFGLTPGTSEKRILKGGQKSTLITPGSSEQK